MKNNLLQRLVRGRFGTLGVLLGLIAFGSAFFSFRGMAIDATSFMETASASVYAILTGIGIYLFWTGALNIVPTLRSVKHRLLGWAGVGAGLIAILLYSALMNATSFRGDAAREHHLLTSIKSAEANLDERYQAAQELLGLLPDLRNYGRRYAAFAEDEFERGIYSSAPGTGAVHVSLLAIASSLDNLALDIDSYETNAAAIYSRASARLTEMRRIRLTDEPLPERMRAIEQQFDLMGQDLADMDPRIPASATIRVSSSMVDEINVEGMTYSRNREVATRQRAALLSLRADVGRASENLRAAAATIADGELRLFERFQPLSATKAVLTYWAQYVPEIAGAIALDFSPLFLLILMCVGVYEKTREELKHDAFASITVEELIMAGAAGDVVKRSHLSPRGMEAAAQRTLGFLDNDEDHQKGAK